MESNHTSLDRKYHKKFIFLLIILLLINTGIITALILSLIKDKLILYQFIFLISLSILILGILIIGTNLFIGILLWYNKRVPVILKKFIKLSMKIVFPSIMFLNKFFKFDKNVIRCMYTDLNNYIVLSNEHSEKSESILILTPHCIQNSNCIYKITNVTQGKGDIYNCRRCGKCDIHDILDLKEKYNVQFYVVTGGTLARKIIADIKPHAIIAIACERDLMSGLQDIKTIPIIAIRNKRPEGPCVNTHVDLEQVERAILHFRKE